MLGGLKEAGWMDSVQIQDGPRALEKHHLYCVALCCSEGVIVLTVLSCAMFGSELLFPR